MKMFKLNPDQVLSRAILASSLALFCVPGAHAQASAAQASGTVKTNNGSTLTVTKADGTTVSVPISPDAVVEQIEPGAKDLKAAQKVQMSEIVAGDRVIVGVKSDTDKASRVIVMKSSDISARNAAEQQDWQRRGTGGIIKSVDASAITVSSGAKTIKVETTPKTIFRRYAPDSVKFQDAAAGTLADIRPGDQLSVRGDKSADGLTVTAEEVVTGSFANLSGLLTAVDPATNTVTFKDLTTKKSVTVKITANSDVRNLPATTAARFSGAGGSGAPGNGGADGQGRPAGNAGGATGSGGARSGGAGSSGAGSGGAGSGGAGGTGGGGRARAGMDLSRMLARLPKQSLTDLHPKDAVMIVASPSGGPDSFTAITLLSGVEALLTAPAGAAPITLSPWSIGAPGGAGGGGPE